MKLTVLGSGTAIPTPERKASGFLIETENAQLLVDGGSGSVHSLAVQGVHPLDLDAGIYTHRHLDHTGDLATLLFAMRASGRNAEHGNYPIFAGAGFAGFLEKLNECYPNWLAGPDWTVTVEELPLEGPGQATLPGAVGLTTLPANHSAGALHLAFHSQGRTLVFSGDTGPSEALEELSRGVDLLVCECALRGPKKGVKHLWPQAVRDLLKRAQPKRVLLTHFYAEVDEGEALQVIRESGVPVERAFDGQQVVV